MGGDDSDIDCQLEKETVIVEATRSTKPKNATHWSVRSMARHQGVSSSAVQRIWKAYPLQPHRVKHFKFSTDPEFVSKVRDIVGLYHDFAGFSKINTGKW